MEEKINRADDLCGVGLAETVLDLIGFQKKFSRACVVHDNSQEDKIDGLQYEPLSWEELDDRAARNMLKLAVTEYSPGNPIKYAIGTAWNLVLVAGAEAAMRSWTFIKRRTD